MTLKILIVQKIIRLIKTGLNWFFPLLFKNNKYNYVVCISMETGLISHFNTPNFSNDL